MNAVLPSRLWDGSFLSGIDGGIHEIDVLLVELFAQQLNSLAEALEMYDLALAQEADHVVHVRIVAQPQDVVIRYTRLLLCCNCENTTFCIYICGKYQKFQ